MALILLVDDDTSMRHFLGTALVRAGHEVEQCENGRAALTHLQEGKHNGYDLLLTDIVMPEMDGIELSQKVQLIVSVEEHIKIGGLGSAISDTLNDHFNQNTPKLIKLAIPDQFPDKYGTQEDLLKYYSLDSKSIYQTISRYIKSKGLRAA